MLLVDVIIVRPAISIELHGEAVDDFFSVVRILILRPLAGPNKLSELILRVVHVPVDGIILCFVAENKLFVVPRVCLHDV